MDSMQQACHNILLHSCSLENGEDLVILYYDITRRKLAHKSAETAAGARGFPYLFEIGFERKLDAFPKLAVKLLENVHPDVLILLSSRNLLIDLRLSDHLHVHRGRAGLQARTLYIPAFPIDSLLRMASADVVEIEVYAARLLNALENAKDLRVWAPGVTDVRFINREFYLFKYKVSKPGDYAIYHVGEVTTTPFESTVNGTIVYDGSFAGYVLANPFRLVVKDGRVVALAPCLR